MSTFTYTEELTVVSCWCGMTYAVPEALYRHMRTKRDNNERQPDVYCPLGHTWVISGQSELDKERDRAKRLERTLANREEDLRSERASHIATKGQLTKTRRRVSNGVCPCCNRSFVQLTRHMKTKHPEYIS